MSATAEQQRRGLVQGYAAGVERTGKLRLQFSHSWKMAPNG